MLEKVKLWSGNNVRLILLSIASVFTFFLPFLLTRDWLNGYGDFYTATAANIGQTIGGITAPFVGLLGAWLLYLTLMAQTKESKSNEQSRVLDRLDKYLVEPIKIIKEEAEFTANSSLKSIPSANDYRFSAAIETFETIFSTEVYKSLTNTDNEVNLFKSILCKNIEKYCLDFIRKYLQLYANLENGIMFARHTNFPSKTTLDPEGNLVAQLEEYVDKIKTERKQEAPIPEELLSLSSEKIETGWIEKLYSFDTQKYPALLDEEERLLAQAREFKDQEIKQRRDSGHLIIAEAEEEYQKTMEEYQNIRKNADEERNKTYEERLKTIHKYYEFTIRLISSYNQMRVALNYAVNK